MYSDHRSEDQAVAICPICRLAQSKVLFQAASWEPIARDHIYEVRCCKNCGATFTSPDIPPKMLGVFYSQGLYKDTRNLVSPVVDAISNLFQWSRLRKVTRFFQRGKLLDVGCGKGRFLAYAAQQGWNVYGIEPSENGRKVASRRLGDRVSSNLDELNVNEKFDVITLWHVLEHVSEPAEMLRQIRPYIKPEGAICVAVPNFASLQAQIGSKHWSHLDIPRHRTHFTPSTLEYMLDLTGYRIIWIDHNSIEFNLIGVLQTALNLLGCEPGFIYALVKRNLSRHTALSTSRLFYSVIMAVVVVPILIVPSFLFAYFESMIGRGGTILVCAIPVKPQG
ncbi:MAG: class I SAM-dependent methyltransferase [Anaerolineales bacterium]